MGLFSKRSAPSSIIVPPEGFERRMSPENPQNDLTQSLQYLGGIDFAAEYGAAVTPRSALQTAVVYACVRIISEAIGSLPFHVYQRLSDRKVRIASDIPVYDLVHRSPNAYQTAAVHRETQQARTTLWGNSYSVIQRDLRTGEPLAILPVPSEKVDVRGNGSVKWFLVDGRFQEVDEDVIHIPGLGLDGYKGLSVVALMRRAIGQTLAQDHFGESFYRHGTKLSGVLTHPGKISAEAQMRLKASWSDTYAGRTNAGKVALLEEGMKFESLNMPLEDAQFIESRRFQVSEIARMFRVPLHMLGDLSKATFNNMEQMSAEFIRDTLMPWVIRWEQEYDRKLLTEQQRREGYYFKFNLGGLLRGDMKTRYEAYKMGREGGWLSVNDIRELEDMDAIENGDVYLQPLNYAKAGDETPEKDK